MVHTSDHFGALCKLVTLCLYEATGTAALLPIYPQLRLLYTKYFSQNALVSHQAEAAELPMDSDSPVPIQRTFFR